MKIAEFTETQKQALLDLLVAGMYADHNLASAEDAYVQRLLDQFGLPSAYDKQKLSDAACTRVSRQMAGSPAAVRDYVAQLATHFPAPEMRRTVYDALNDLLTSDGRVTSEESQLLSALREVFQL